MTETLSRESAVTLREWYADHHRDLPWRRTHDAYGIWISEVMLQQTRTETVIPYWLRFMQELPALKALAECPEEKLLKLWEGLGYYSRARNLQRCARTLVSAGKDCLPDSYDELLSLPGIGPYTAGAVSSIAYGLPHPAVDGNVLRVLTRLFAVADDIRLEKTKQRITSVITSFYAANTDLSADPDFVRDLTQGFMELGAVICIPGGHPHCTSCPWQSVCRTHREKRTDEIPFRSPLKQRRSEKRTVLVIRDDHHLLLRKRPDTGLLAGLYEFVHLPGMQDRRAVQEYCASYDWDILSVQSLSDRKHIFTHLEWDMKAYLVRVGSLSGTLPENCVCVRADETSGYALAGAFAYYMRAVTAGEYAKL